MKTDLSQVSYDSELAAGARNVVSPCLAIRPEERVVLLGDRLGVEIAAAIAEQIRAVGSPLEAFILEDYIERPTTTLPEPIADAFRNAQVSVFCCEAKPGELAMRRAMTGIVADRGMRHGHMVGITPRIMKEGMRADFEEIARLTEWVRERAMVADEIHCKTPAGTDIRATFSRDLKWIPTPGIITPKKWGNLPGGETFTSPARVDGVFVVDGVLGDWLAPKYGEMSETPLTIEIENSRIVSTKCDHEEALADFNAYTTTDENSNRVGEFALGTNTAVTELIGNMLQDEKIPGVHIAFGHPYSRYTGATWKSTTHIDVVGRRFDVEIDGTPIMRDGKYLTNGH